MISDIQNKEWVEEQITDVSVSEWKANMYNEALLTSLLLHCLRQLLTMNFIARRDSRVMKYNFLRGNRGLEKIRTLLTICFVTELELGAKT